jgi:hypothetical protein
MNEDFRFKVKGVKKLMTINELKNAGWRNPPRCIKIIDVNQKRTWVSDYRTILSKFG